MTDTDTDTDPVATPSAETVVRAWIDALRSGTYAQGERYLRAGEKYCCLGVLTDIAIARKWVDGEWRAVGHDAVDQIDGVWTAYANDPLDLYGERHYLPNRVADLVGLDTEGHFPCDKGDWASLKHQPSLIEANDNGFDFAAIAAALETDYLPIVTAREEDAA